MEPWCHILAPNDFVPENDRNAVDRSRNLIHEPGQGQGRRAPPERDSSQASKARRPFLTSVKHRDDFEPIPSRPVRDHVRCPGYDHFSSAGNAAWPTKVGEISEAFDSTENSPRGSTGRSRIVARDELAEIDKMADRAWRPDDGHTRGALRSRLPPHERSHPETCLCPTPRPASSSARPASI